MLRYVLVIFLISNQTFFGAGLFITEDDCYRGGTKLGIQDSHLNLCLTIEEAQRKFPNLTWL